MASTRSRSGGREHARPASGVAGEHTPRIFAVAGAGIVVVIAFLALTGTGHVIDAATQHFMLFYAGVFALIGLCASVGLGLVATNRMFLGPAHRVFIQSAHRAASFGAVTFLIVHIATEILAQRVHAIDAVIPFLSPFRTFYIGLGTIASDLIVLLVITGILRGRFNASGKAWRWRAIHYTSYSAFVFGVWHGLLAGRPGKPYIDWSYGFLVALVLLGLAVRLFSDSLKPKENLSGPPVPMMTPSASAPLRAAAMAAQLSVARGGIGRSPRVTAAQPVLATPLGAPVITATALPAAEAPARPPFYEPGYEGPARYLGASRSTGPIPRAATGPIPRAATGPQPSAATGQWPSAATGPQPRLGAGAFPPQGPPQPPHPSGPFRAADTGPFRAADTGPQPVLDRAPRPAHPSGPFPAMGTGPLPASGSGPRPAHPSGPFRAPGDEAWPRYGTGPLPQHPGGPFAADSTRPFRAAGGADSLWTDSTDAFPAGGTGPFPAPGTGSFPAHSSGPLPPPAGGPRPRPVPGRQTPAEHGQFGRGDIRPQAPSGPFPRAAGGSQPSAGDSQRPRWEPGPPPRRETGPVAWPGDDQRPDGRRRWEPSGPVPPLYDAWADSAPPPQDAPYGDRGYGPQAYADPGPVPGTHGWSGGRSGWPETGHDGSWQPARPPWEGGLAEADLALRYREPGPGMPGYRGSRENRYGGDRHR